MLPIVAPTSPVPDRILLAEKAASDAAYLVRLCGTPFTAEAREYQLAELARANKVLASFDPRLVVTAGGTR
ncbi:hypothetical protein [Streptomyces candidus]|uniref:Uncharacterized protein n=1 Tax=Streptomyces candidus TaxID=67283 RepID=A0A7X0HPF0_9ACTN|nr:hypothetical protein [Streptomyces candidus]MBB6439898.1 hypothetical protein [Streptomyces candidus]